MAITSGVTRRSARALAVLALLLAVLAPGCDEPTPVLRDVVLVSIDTLRADGLSSYGNPRPTSPHLDALARTGFVFEQCYAPAPETAPSHASMFTGLGTAVHRVANLRLADQPTPGLASAFDTLAERFSRAGYRTAAFTDGGPLGTAWDLQQGFQVHHGRLEGVEAKVDRALAFLRASGDERPVFLFLHTYQVHLPYVAPIEWAHRFTDPGYDGVLVEAEASTRAARDDGTLRPDGKILLRDEERFTPRDVEHLKRLYEGEIAFTDHHLQRLWTFLSETGRLERTVVAVTSDHGEEFGEHGFFGHRQLHVESLHVPLVLRLPRGTAGDDLPVPPAGGGRVSARVGLIDLYPTLLEAAGLAIPAHAQGRSLVAGLRLGRFEDEPSVALTTAHFYGGGHMRWRQSVRSGSHALLRDVVGGRMELRLYDLSQDAGEHTPLTSGDDVSKRLAALLDGAIAEEEQLRASLLAGGSEDAHATPDAATLSELDSLGYLGPEGGQDPAEDD
jgi:arylsulfatase A-like enzyme